MTSGVEIERSPADRDVVAEYLHPRLTPPQRYDEMADPTSGIRASWRSTATTLRDLGTSGLGDCRRGVERLLADDAVTYRPAGSSHDQPWALDPVPLLLTHAEWTEIEAGVRQRAELLDLILTDLYGPRTLLRSGLLPAEVVFGHDGFLRPVDQLPRPGQHELFLTATDLGRDPDGRLRVIADRTQAPSGAGYAMADRLVVSRAIPALYRDTRVHRLRPFFDAMRSSLHRLAGPRDESARVVLLTPGAQTETAYDQANLAALLGIPLVEGADLVVRDGRVWQHSIGGVEPVDVILRRVDAAYCDPLELRADSRLGVPGLVQAARLGSVAIANGLGTGVLENPGLFPFLPRIAEVLLSTPLRLASAPTWWCGDELSRRHVIAHLSSLIIKPITPLLGHRAIVGRTLSAAERDDLARHIEAEPYRWVGQQEIALSHAPTVGPGGLEPRPVTVRTFAVSHAGGYLVLSGGLARVGPDSAAVIISNSAGAVAKDVWVIARDQVSVAAVAAPETGGASAVTAAVSPRIAADLFHLGRHAERAEGSARLIGATLNRSRDVHSRADAALVSCLSVLLTAVTELTTSDPAAAPGPTIAPSAPTDDEAARPRATAALLHAIGARERTGTVAHDARRVRELATAVRDQLSGDTWVVLGRLERALSPFDRPPVESADIPVALDTVVEALLAFSGLAAENMVRDQGWHLLDAGRRIERATQLALVLRAGLAQPRAVQVEDLVTESVLIATETIITSRRRYGAGSSVDTVLTLLLFDQDNPRSVAYQLHRLGADLDGIAVAGSAATRLRRQLAAIGDRLDRTDAAQLAVADGSSRHQLDDLLGRLVDDLRALAGAIADTHFPPATGLRPMNSSDSTFAVRTR